MNDALALWLRWFREDGAPFVADGSDMGYADYCFFCGEDEPGHSADCIFLEAQRLVGVQKGVTVNEATEEAHSKPPLVE